MLEKKKVAPHERISLSSIVRYEDGEIVMPLRDVCKKEVVLLGGIKADVTISYVMSSKSNGYRAYRKARAYVGVKNESLAENLVNRRNRPVVQYKKIVQQVLWALNMETKFAWSQYAGCSCPCSPGFILDGYAYGEMWIEIDYANNLLNDGNEEDLTWYANQFGIKTPSFEEAISRDEVLV